MFASSQMSSTRVRPAARAVPDVTPEPFQVVVQLMSDRHPAHDLAVDLREQERRRDLGGSHIDAPALLLNTVHIGSPRLVRILKDELEVIRSELSLSHSHRRLVLTPGKPQGHRGVLCHQNSMPEDLTAGAGSPAQQRHFGDGVPGG